MKSNFRRGGLFLLPAVLMAILIALLVSAPTAAIISISIIGLLTAFILILLGDKSNAKSDKN